MTGNAIWIALATAVAQPSAPVERARALLGAGDVQAALALLRSEVRSAPGDAALHNMLGAILNREGRYREALPHAMEAARLQPDNARYRYNRGIVLAEHGRFADALADFDFALARTPNEAPMYLERGAARLSLGRADAARADWAAARRLAPDLAWTDWYEGLHDLIDGRAAAAIPKLQAVAKANPDFANAELWLVVAHLLSGGGYGPASVQDAWVGRLLAYHGGKLPFDQLHAIAEADRQTGDARRRGEAWLHHGLRLERDGRVAQARAAFEAAIAVEAPRHAWKLLAERRLAALAPK